MLKISGKIGVAETQAYKEGYHIISGIDEAGRGPLAGPVYAAAVILDPDNIPEGLDDSKKLSAKKREHLFDIITHTAFAFAIYFSTPEVIDRINILEATKSAMKMSLNHIAGSYKTPDIVFIDGNFGINSRFNEHPIIKGDTLSYNIAAASILAKVSRDRKMIEYASVYPAYGFEKHKGYPTRAHIIAIQKFGVSPIHRKTFHRVKEYL